MTEHTADTRPPLLPGAHGAGIGITTFGTLFTGFSGTYPEFAGSTQDACAWQDRARLPKAANQTLVSEANGCVTPS